VLSSVGRSLDVRTTMGAAEPDRSPFRGRASISGMNLLHQGRRGTTITQDNSDILSAPTPKCQFKKLNSG
jgi:hypothetical protein